MEAWMFVILKLTYLRAVCKRLKLVLIDSQLVRFALYSFKSRLASLLDPTIVQVSPDHRAIARPSFLMKLSPQHIPRAR